MKEVSDESHKKDKPPPNKSSNGIYRPARHIPTHNNQDGRGIGAGILDAISFMGSVGSWGRPAIYLNFWKE